MEDQEKASQNKQKAEAKQVQIEETKKEIDERTKKVNDELSTVVPKMEAAKQAIGNIDKKKVAALKALKTVKDYLKVPLKLAAIIYMKFAKKKMVEKMEWDEIKNCIIKEDFISTIKNVKAEELGAKLTSFIQKEINNPDNEWDLDKIRKGFLETGLLAEWIEATVACANINNQMEPLKKEIAGLNAEKDKVVNEFNEIAKEKEMLEKSIQQLKINYEESIVESNNIKKKLMKK